MESPDPPTSGASSWQGGRPTTPWAYLCRACVIASNLSTVYEVPERSNKFTPQAPTPSASPWQGGRPPTPCLPLGTVLSPFLFPQQHHASLYQSHDLCPQAGAEDCPNSSTTRTTATRTIPVNIDVTSIPHARDVAPSKIACHLALFRLVSCTLDGRTFKTDRRAAKRPSDMSHVPTSTHLPARVGKWAGRADA